MATIEREYNVPLRHGWLRVQKYKRAKRAVTELRTFLQRHMKSQNVKLGRYVNEAVWGHGIRNPPHHVKVNVRKTDDGEVYAELVGKPMPGKEEKAAKTQKEVKADKKAETKTKADAKTERKTAEKATKSEKLKTAKAESTEKKESKTK